MKLFNGKRNFGIGDRKDEYGFTDKFYDRLAAGLVIVTLIIVVYLIRTH